MARFRAGVKASGDAGRLAAKLLLLTPALKSKLSDEEQ